MCTQQMMRMRQNTSNSKSWQEMFPNPQLSEQISATFLKKLVAIAISNITYLRNIFPEGAFADRYLEGLNLKVLRDDGCFPAVSQLIRWIKGSFEALDHKFLRQLIIGIYNDPSNPNNVLETYSFHFSYTNKRLSGCTYYQDDGRNKKEVVTEKFVSSEETFRQTISLFRHCIMCTHSLKPLPQGSMINMRLLYYDEVTPDDYEPPGFKPSPVASYTFVNDPILLNLGETNTPWHGMKLLLATDSSDFEVATEDTANAANAETTKSGDGQHGTMRSSSQPEKSSTLKTPFQGQIASTSNDEPKSVNAIVPSISPAHPASAVSTTGSSWADGAEPDGQRVRCPCGTMVEVGLMVMCTNCKYWQHANCFKILTEDELPQNHVCELCHSPDSQCTDDSLLKLMPNQRKEICQYRRALGLCSESYRMSESDLIENLSVDVTLAQKIMSKLDKDGVFKLTNKRSKGKYRLINKPQLKKTAIPAHFSKNPEPCEVINTSKTQEDIEEDVSSQMTQENPQTIEAMTEKLSISKQTEEKSMDATKSENKGKKRNLLAMMKHTTNASDSEKECNTQGAKRCKASISDLVIF